MAEKVYLNGELIDASAATVSVFDSALQHGVGLFEVLRVYAAKPFRLGDHIKRLKNSAADLGTVVDHNHDAFERAISKLLQANELTDARVRITVTGGSVRVGIHRGGQCRPNTLITAGATQIMPDTLYQDGVGVLISDYRVSPNDPIARHKTVSYLPRLTALRTAQQAQLADALWFTTDGYLASGSTSNVFLISDDILLTPSPDLPIIPGVTREVVIELAKSEQIPLREARLTMKDLLSADEIFLTSSVVQLLPVVAVERHLVGTGRVGPLTRTLLQKYRRCVREELGLT